MSHTCSIGLDVHKESIAIAHTRQGSREVAVYRGKFGGGNLAAERSLRALGRKPGEKTRIDKPPPRLLDRRVVANRLPGQPAAVVQRPLDHALPQPVGNLIRKRPVAGPLHG